MISTIQHSLEGLLALGLLVTGSIVLYGVKNPDSVNITVNGNERSLRNPVDYPVIVYALLLSGVFILAEMTYEALNTRPAS